MRSHAEHGNEGGVDHRSRLYGAAVAAFAIAPELPRRYKLRPIFTADEHYRGLPMSGAKRTFRLLTQIIVWLTVTAVMPAWADAPAPPSDKALIEQIAAGKKQLEEKTDLDEAIKAKIRELYDKAAAEMEKAKAAAAQAATFEQRAGHAQPELAQTKADLAALPAKSDAGVYDDRPLPDIEKKVAQLEADLKRWRRELTDVDAELKGRTSRRAEVPKRIAAAQQVLTDTNNEMQAPAASGDNPQVQAARGLMLAARKRAAELEIQSCEKELRAYDARAELLPLLRDLDARRVAQADQDFNYLQDLINRRRQIEAEQQARKARQEANRANPAVQKLMEDNAKLAKMREELAQDILDATGELDRVTQRLADVSEKFDSVKDKADSVGLASVIGPLLRKQRAALPDLSSYRHNVGLRGQAMGTSELARLELREQRFALSDLDRQVKATLKALTLPAADGNRSELKAAVTEALKSKRDYLDGLIADHEKYYDKLAKLKTAEEQLIEKTERCSRFIDERVLWIASADPIAPKDAAPAAEALWWLAGPAAWSDLGRTLATDARREAILWAVAALVLLTLIYWRRRLRGKIAELGEKTARGSCCRFLPTVEAAVLTVLVAAAWPGLVWWIGWRLWPEAEASDALRLAVGAGLTTVARVFLALELLRHACSPGGLAESHFGWPAAALKVVRQSICRLYFTGLPLMFVAVAMTWQNKDAWDASLGRFCCAAALSCFSLALHRVFRPSGVVVQSMIAANRGGWVERFRYVWYPLITFTPAVLALLALGGYHYTARQLATRLILTSYVLVGGLVCRALLLRWILVNKRKLAIEQARQRRAAQIESAGGEESCGGAELPASAEPQRDLATINAQTKHLIEYSLAVAAALALWFAWVDVLPALSILNSVKLWHTEIAVTDLGLAALVLATTVIAAKNFPGLLEMAVLQHLPLDAGARYAVATVCRYLITVTGTVLCFGTLGVGWKDVQWLIAAMSLGLGFGLQEIFANFVSGLIILFERPVRVGDVVTIDEISGVVSRIRIRATTITDWDRKELIIPNKEFITGRVLNWTLSNQTNRVVVEVGVAYGTDTALATKILLEVAQNHPLVLKDPPPHALFDSFGASALNFIMRCYLPNLDNRLSVIHELNVAVDREFRAAGIEIAFPQQDVHIRSLEVPLPLVSGLAGERRGFDRAENAAKKRAG